MREGSREQRLKLSMRSKVSAEMFSLREGEGGGDEFLNTIFAAVSVN